MPRKIVFRCLDTAPTRAAGTITPVELPDSSFVRNGKVNFVTLVFENQAAIHDIKK